VSAAEYDTPALMLDMDALERNIKRMADYFRGKKANLRPHVKPHKSPLIAHKQIAAGAKGITCAKLGEAEVMARAGITDILVANEVVGATKLSRLAKLARYCDIIVAVDNVKNAKQISKFAVQEGSTVHVLVDLNLGGETHLEGILDRCGVTPGTPTVALANEIAKLKNVRFKGLMGYEGGLRQFPNFEQKKVAATKALNLLVGTRDLIQDSGLQVDIVSCGGTMSYNIAGEFPGVTEVQAGGYVLMDESYRRAGLGFDIAATVLTSVVSTPRPEKLIVDAGLKAITTDHGLPVVKDSPGLEVIAVNSEHGHIHINEPGIAIEIEDKLELIPAYIDTTVALYNEYVMTRGKEVEDTLDVAARGEIQ